MSWELVLFNTKKKLNSIDEIDELYLENIDFDKILSEFFINRIENKNHIEIRHEDFSIEYFKDEELTSNKILTLHGENGIYEVVKFAMNYNLQIFDTSLEKFIDLENPNINGYKNFQIYLKNILIENEK